MAVLGAANRAQSDPAIDRRETTSVLHRECQQVDVAELFRPQDSIRIEYFSIENGNIGRPERMVGFRPPAFQQLVRGRNRE